MDCATNAQRCSPGELFIVATPIGNLEDISLRALRILREADLIVAEDTRVTRKLLTHYGITTPTTSYHQHSKGAKARYLVDLLERGQRIALVSDAGMPGISDPGHELIGLAIERGIKVTPVPGPVAATAALAASGLPAHRFVFDGFPPRQKKNRVEFFRRLRTEERTIILYESPRRTHEALKDLLEVLGDRRAVLARELTKLFEEFRRGRLSELLEYTSEHQLKGEVVIVVEGYRPQSQSDAECVRTEYLPEGATTRDVAAELMKRGMSHREAYKAALKMRCRDAEASDDEGVVKP
ncbi:MAG: 16S rRNA (cytidine(1402)-2'-O)-methyltransferase [Armatimonadota bacterium]